MNNPKCETCANRHTPWCKGCEYNFSGLEQFDFYQEVKKTEGDDYCG